MQPLTAAQPLSIQQHTQQLLLQRSLLGGEALLLGSPGGSVWACLPGFKTPLPVKNIELSSPTKGRAGVVRRMLHSGIDGFGETGSKVTSCWKYVAGGVSSGYLKEGR